MYDQEKIKPYNGKGDKGKLVEEMFDNIASTYDTLNHRLSWDIDKGWRKRAIQQLKPFRPEKILDIATGTGDFAILAAKELKPKNLIGADISEGMMSIGRKKVKTAGLQNIISFKREDCLNLSFPENTFDAVTAAFGIRNFQDLDRGLTEKQLFHIYSNTIMPLYGKLISKDSNAYEYLNKTIAAFPQGEKMMEIFKKAGFSKMTFHRLTYGICTMYFAEK